MSAIPDTKSISYTAPWPKELDPAHEPLWSKIARIVWNIVSLIIFPIGLCRLVHAQLRHWAFSLIVPGGSWQLGPFGLKRWGEGLIRDFNANSLTLTTPDGAKIDGILYPGLPNKAIIYAGGNCQQWEGGPPDVPKGPSVLMINPRGVGQSTGTRTPEGYALDIYTAYKFLIEEKGIDPEDIVLIGMSMGSAYGTLGASLIQKEYPDKKINVINRNSFAYLSREIHTLCGKIAQDFWLPHFVGSIPTWIGAKLLNLEMDVKSAWDTLKGKKVVFYHPHDEIIPESASLAKEVKDDRITKIYFNSTHYHNDHLCAKTYAKYSRHIHQMLRLPVPNPATVRADYSRFHWSPF